MTSPQPEPVRGLRVENLESVYNKAVTAISGVSLEVPEGKIVSLVGVNGSGKSTTLNAIAGLLPGDPQEITDGKVWFDGERLDGLPPHTVVRRGVVLVPEREKIFETLTVAENLQASVPRIKNDRKRLEEVYELFPALVERQASVAGYLSGGQRQMLAFARALLCHPRLLLVDEMTLGLAPLIIQDLLVRLASMRDRLGVSVLLVEQNVNAALEVADYGYIMERGRIVFHGTPEKLRSHDDVREFYLGLGTAGARSYRDVKQYRRARRWWG
jgi:branched-chain amino acid transport system ATP-binding protein